MFTDIKTEAFSTEEINAINFVSNAGIILGYMDGSFQPFILVTNAELCRILYEIVAIDPQENLNFPHIYLADHWAARYVNFVLNEVAPNAEILKIPFSISVSEWVDKISKQDDLWIVKSFLSLYVENESIFSPKSREICRLDIAEIIYSSFKKIWSKQENSLIWNDCLVEWGMTHYNCHHLKPNLFFWRKQYDLNHSKSEFDFLSSIAHLISASEEKKIKEQFDCLYNLPSKVDEIQNLEYFKVDADQVKTAYHYTSLSSLYAMIKYSMAINSTSVFLHLSNIAYLNDPAEGSLLIEKLSGKLDKEDKISIPISQTFISSLILASEELLPMWVQYADNAKGCRIEFELNGTEFKRVRYCLPTGKIDTSQDTLENSQKQENILSNKITELINGINTAFPQKNQTLVNYLKKSLDKIRFLFKSSYYQHESEIRLIDNVKPENAKLLTDPDYIQSPEDIPRLYVNSEKPFKIKSIMLGPKCPNPEKIDLYLHSQGIKNVQRSSIEFR